MLWLVLLGFAVAAAAPVLHRFLKGATGGVLALYPLVVLVQLQQFDPAAATRQAFTWLPALGIDVALRIDGLGILFGSVVAGIGALILVYGGSYLHGDPRLPRFYLVVVAFMTAMLGTVLAGDVVLLFVMWELTSITSYLLIGYDHHREKARKAALQALLVTGGGGLAMLAGLLLLARAAGTTDLGAILAAAERLRTHEDAPAIVLLLLAGAFTKSAQWPFHFWLPNAMEAPTPVSAYLHSATMVKLGVFLLARFSPVFAGTETWVALVVPVGAATLLVGGALSAVQRDLKKLLAYTTVGALGALTLLLGIGGEKAAAAAMAFLLAHAFYKGALFMAAGAVDHGTGTRDLARLGGLRRALPATAGATFLAAASLLGVAPLFGFVAKEKFFLATASAGAWAWPATVVAVVGSALMAAAGLRMAVGTFLGPLRPTPHVPHEASPAMWIGPVLLAALGVVGGLAPGLFAERLVEGASAQVLGRAVVVEIVLWHGFNLVLALSLATLALALVLWRAAPRLEQLAASGAAFAARFGPARLYQRAFDGVLGLARWQTRTLQGGSLRVYILIVVGTTALLAAFAMVGAGAAPSFAGLDEVRLHEVLLVAVLLAGAVLTVVARTRMQAVAALGIVGYAVAMVFLLFGAPDLALTQFAIETLTVVIFVLVVHQLPPFVPKSGRSTRRRDLAVAAAAGAVMAALVLAANALEPNSALKDFFAAASVPEGQGRNVVNVILVDFRALDTLGEITVLGIAALGVAALLRLRTRPGADGAGEGR